MATFDRAELSTEEEYEETVKEKVYRTEEAPKEDEAMPPAEGEAPAEEAPAEGEKTEEKAEEKKKEEPKFDWVDVKKMKKRTKVTNLEIARTGLAGMSDAQLQAAADAETKIRADMRELEETDNARNDLETYIYTMRDKTSEGGQYGAYILPADREVLHAELTKAEDWLYDTFDGTKLQYVEKKTELEVKGEPPARRYKAKEARDDYEEVYRKTIAEYRQAQSEDKYSHIAQEKKQSILDECQAAEGWLAAKKEEQAGQPPHADAVYSVEVMSQKVQDLKQFADKILSEPKPAPPPAPPAETAEKTEEKAADTAAPEEPDQKEVEASLDVD
jgi:heat shock protein 4